MEIPILTDLVIISALSIVVLVFCHRLHIPSIVGFILTGLLIGPHGFKLVDNVHDVQTLADIGIVFLLFTVGMEFSLKKIFEYKRYFILGGLLQVGLTTFVGYLIGTFLDRPAGESLFLGFLLALSSTAIVLHFLESKGQTDSPHGKIILGIAIFQDLAAVPMMLMTPFLGGHESSLEISIFPLLLKGVALLALVYVASQVIVPRLLYYIARTRSRELFLLSTLLICFSIAWLSSSIGLSLALGAFLAGLSVSETEYKNEAIGDIVPFKDLFTSLFFVTIGMFLDFSFFVAHPLLIVSLAIGIVLMKAFIAQGTALLLGAPLRTAILTGFALAQISEFSFVLAKSGKQFGIGSDFNFQLFLTVAVLTMTLTPFLMNIAPTLSDWFHLVPFSKKFHHGLMPINGAQDLVLEDHIIIVGYGMCGKHVAFAAKESGIPYVILETNPDTVKMELRQGEPIHFGDATHDCVLEHADIKNAKALCILINDPAAVHRIVQLARKLNPQIYLIVRTRYAQEMKELFELGADDVIPDEFGSSVEIFTRVMRNFQIPASDIEQIVAHTRSEGYQMMRLLYKNPSSLMDVKIGLSELGIESLRIGANHPYVGKQMSQINIRDEFGLTIILIKRENRIMTTIASDTVLEPLDTIVVVGNNEGIQRIKLYFRGFN